MAEQTFDACALGCADIAPEFRTRIADVAVGERLTVVVADPAAKQDLPSLARMGGHTVVSERAHDDGRLEITVERGR